MVVRLGPKMTVLMGIKTEVPLGQKKTAAPLGASKVVVPPGVISQMVVRLGVSKIEAPPGVISKMVVRLGRNKMKVPLRTSKMEAPPGVKNQMGVRLGTRMTLAPVGVNRMRGPHGADGMLPLLVISKMMILVGVVGANKEVAAVLAGGTRITVGNPTGVSKTVEMGVLAGTNKMVGAAAVLPGVSRIMGEVVLVGLNRAMVVLDSVVIRVEVGRNLTLGTTMTTVVVVVGLVEEEGEVSAEVETSGVEEEEEGHWTVISHPVGIKKTLGRPMVGTCRLGRATKVVDQTGRKGGERIRPAGSRLVHLVEKTGLRTMPMTAITELRDGKMNLEARETGEAVVMKQKLETTHRTARAVGTRNRVTMHGAKRHRVLGERKTTRTMEARKRVGKIPL